LVNRVDWRDERYARFYEVVDTLVEEILDIRWEDGKKKRRLKGDQLTKLRYSVETLVRDCVAVVYQRERKGEAVIRLGQNAYGGSDGLLSYNIHVGRGYAGLKRLGYIEETRKGVYDRESGRAGRPRNRLTRYVATDKLVTLFTSEEQKVLPVIVPPKREELLKVTVKHTENGHSQKVSHPAPDTEDAARMRVNLKIINEVLQRSWYDLAPIG